MEDPVFPAHPSWKSVIINLNWQIRNGSRREKCNLPNFFGWIK